ncbi:5-formyltetrahydrofolate cyclo-ligase [Kitasatospora xanthocidica]|uniref:5-formyltetrahydrofolate cyclo-ligase n=1 Tax=Kitasatospora xanthocidica TaxID=83382 RepID=A0A373A1I7_9ACTN|nr:5-formyltetrahydrofolate cyclo-ligase [Kitasatospora xanthocidica]RGD62016.1 5-formyltetrahydrofolate cyclo-ligase [Kitasatospora xanthocidica]
MSNNVEADKSALRERVWSALDAAGAVREPAHGSIPDFHGSHEAAELLAQLPEWRTASVVKAVPDTAQEPIRAIALREGRLVYMAVPRLALPHPFFVLDPAELPSPAEAAANRRTAAASAPTTDVGAMRPVDLIVLGSVAADRSGARIGKGAGYSDLEYALLAEAGLVGPGTVIATTVHQLQLVDRVPMTEHDVYVDLVITPTEVITCPPRPRPAGILWDHLTEEKIASIPALVDRRLRHGRTA